VLSGGLLMSAFPGSIPAMSRGFQAFIHVFIHPFQRVKCHLQAGHCSVLGMQPLVSAQQ
jgi:hypothetical protein